MPRRARLAGVMLRVLLAATAACVWFSTTRARAQAPSVEYAVKATYLYKLAPFVEWPPGALRASDPLVICVAGRDGVGDLIDEAVKGQAAGVRRLRVAHLDAAARDTRCNILYVALRGAAAARILDSVRGQPVLTVTDAAQEPAATGIVNFVVLDNRVRFDIDQRAAAENHLVISSKLLSLAIHVTPRP